MNLPETIYEQHAKDPQLSERLVHFTVELESMSNRIENIFSQNSHEECASEAGFMRQLLSQQRCSIQGLTRQLNENKRELVQNISRNPVAVSSRTSEYQTLQWKMLHRFERQFGRLREDFNWFCMNWA